MMNDPQMLEQINEYLLKMAESIERQEDLPIQYYDYFIEHPDHVMFLVDILGSLPSSIVDVSPSFFSACLLGLEICISQLQSAIENNHYAYYKLMQKLMLRLAHHIHQKKQGVLFWLPVLNAFYEVHVILSPVLQNAYLSLIELEEDALPLEDTDELSAIHGVLSELSDLSSYEMADHFFAQSYAMPPDFFSDLLFDLSSLEEGQSICILALLHPDPAVRLVVMQTLDVLMAQWTLTPQQLFWLRSIQAFGDPAAEAYLARWIRFQRMKGVVFQSQKVSSKVLWIRASEIDGGGAQGIFIAVKEKKMYRLCGLLFKYDLGLKEVWLTAPISKDEFLMYCNDVFDGSIHVKEVDQTYLKEMTNHFLAIMINKGNLPSLHLLELQDLIGELFSAQSLSEEDYFQELSVLVHPFTEDTLKKSFSRSKRWVTQGRYTQAWFVESPLIDKIVNEHCSFQGEMKLCNAKEAAKAVITEGFENERDRWAFYFLWMALWLKSKTVSKRAAWKDPFLLAYVIKQGYPLKDLPIMQAIADETVLNSLDTMEARQTHLSLS